LHLLGWHAYGLLQRADRKYDEAIKCYRNALKWEKVSFMSVIYTGNINTDRLVKYSELIIAC